MELRCDPRRICFIMFLKGLEKLWRSTNRAGTRVCGIPYGHRRYGTVSHAGYGQ